jgi:hypothetical protein
MTAVDVWATGCATGCAAGRGDGATITVGAAKEGASMGARRDAKAIDGRIG